ncbi:hypothetical protein [uncultured Deinococcus sp.]|uniref:hypothetical protein n=1 Tax=uncultured Deinococcus sp. TaxID=158789 RepID=UPI0025DAA21F|nr:hypothetical protein [uncultured Deinococcus sp.]
MSRQLSAAETLRDRLGNPLFAVEADLGSVTTLIQRGRVQDAARLLARAQESVDVLKIRLHEMATELDTQVTLLAPVADRPRLQAILDGPRLTDLTHDQVLDHVADQVASSQRLAGVETTSEAVRILLDDHRAVQEKAALWDALLGSARLRLLGWADPTTEGYAHVGLEAWTVYPGHDFTESNHRAREVITAYARAAMRRRETSPSASSPICGTSALGHGLQCGVTPQDEQKG